MLGRESAPLTHPRAPLGHSAAVLGTPGVACCLWNPEHQGLDLQKAGQLGLCAVCWWLFSTWAHTRERLLAGKHVDCLKHTLKDLYEVLLWTELSRICRTLTGYS